MKKTYPILALQVTAVLLFNYPLRAEMTVHSKVVDCLNGKQYPLPHTSVLIFDADKSRRLSQLLSQAEKSLDVPTESGAEKLFEDWDRVVASARATRRLAAGKSGLDGSLTIKVPNGIASLIVFAYLPADDGPAFHFAITRVTVDRRSEVRTLLDFARGHCAYQTGR